MQSKIERHITQIPSAVEGSYANYSKRNKGEDLMKLLVLISFILTSFGLIGQTERIDSLEKALETATNDSIRFNLYNDLSNEVWFTDINYYRDIWLAVIKEMDHPHEDPAVDTYRRSNVPVAYLNLGFYFERVGEPDSAIAYYTESAKRSVENRDQRLLANAYNNLASIYSDQGNYKLGLELYTKAFKIQDHEAIFEGAAVSLNNIGWIYGEQGLYEESIPFYRKSLSIKVKIEDTRGMGFSYNNLGKAYGNLGQIDSSIFYINKAISTWNEIDFYYGLGIAYMNLGNQLYEKDPETAAKHYTEALNYADLSESNEQYANSLIKLGFIDFQNNNYEAALKKALEAESISLEIGYPGMIRDVSDLLQQVYSKKGMWQKAYEQNTRYYEMRDSLTNDETKKNVISAQLEYEFDKKELEDSLRREKINRIKEIEHDQEVARQQVFIYVGFGGLLLALGIVFVVYRSYKNKKRDNEIIAQQKDHVENQKILIEEAHQEITDSIEYAKKIQDAILPPPLFWDKHLKDSFVLYLPKDIVAGDFYWMEVRKGRVFFAAADCTGHGVPGAMVSVVCHNALNRAVREFELNAPGKILDKVTDLVLETFEKSDRKVKDGMDISLCAIEGDQLQFAGAHNPLWLVRSGALDNIEPNLEMNGNYLYEIKADKQPVGQYEHRVPFSTHSIILKKNDQIFLTSDGFPDQFGGHKGKKLKTKAFKKMILENSIKDIPEQKSFLKESFKNWRGNFEQLDDVCVIGVRI